MADPTKICPECGARVVKAEASHFFKPEQRAMEPRQAPRAVAATYTCERGHEWTRSL